MVRRFWWLAFLLLGAGLGILCYLSNPASLPAFGFTLANSGLAWFAWRNNPSRQINRVFAGMSLSIALWGADLVFLHIAPDADIASRWVGAARVGLLMAPAAIWHFAMVLTGRDRGPLWFSIPSFYAISGIFWILSLLGLMGETVEWSASRAMYVPKANHAYTAFIGYVLFAVPASIVLALVAWVREKSPALRTQYRMYVLGMAGMFLLASTNLIAPLGIDVFRHGYLGGVLFGVFFMYAIVRYRWLDLQFVIRRAMLYATLSVGVTAVHLSSLLAASLVLQATGEIRSFTATLVTICVVAFAFSPARDALQNLLDRLFYRAAYDDRLLLRRLSAEVSGAVGIDRIARVVLASLVDAMKLSGATLVVRVPPPDGEPVAHVHGSPQPRRNAPEHSRLLSLLESLPIILDPDDWSEFEPLIGTLDSENVVRVQTWLRNERARLVVPLIARERVLGALVLGGKRSELPFRSEEIQNLSTLANHAAVAIENSRLYEQVLAMRDQNEAILRSMDDGLVALDAQGRVTTINRAAEALLGGPAAGVAGRRYDEALAPYPPFVEFARESLESLRGVDRRELRIEDRTFQIRSTPLKGESAGLLLILEDVTERRRMEERMELERRLATLGEMALQIAHEIRNPINSIKVWSDAVTPMIDDAAFRENYRSTIHPEVERLTRLVDDLLDYARPMRLTKVPLRPADIFESSLRLLAGELEAAGVRVGRRYEDRAPEIVADGERLKQVILNLLKNSIDAMAKSPRRELEVGVQVPNGSVELHVADTGAGMDDAALGRLFTPFFTTKSRGTGLGLAIVHRIAREHGWTLQVRSRPGEGTRLTVRCPTREAQPPWSTK
jgi:two-component system NtrC family sensor kinase